MKTGTIKPICKHLLLTTLAIVLLTGVPGAAEQNTMHPKIPMPDEKGDIVTDSNAVVSTAMTCGQCHDTRYIDKHNIHFNEKVKADCTVCHFKDSKMPADLSTANLSIQLPSDENCASCHGIIHTGTGPMAIPGNYKDIFDYEPGKRYYNITQNTGVILSPQDLADSALNIKEKKSRNFAWDLHTRRQLDCISCHFTRNDPRNAGFVKSSLDHLMRDPRRIKPPHEYIKWPDHRLESAACTDCHNRFSLHKNMPYEQRHLEVLDCQSCHVPKLFGPAFKSVDRTVVTAEGKPGVQLRGVDESRSHWDSLNTQYFEGYRPFLFPYRKEKDNRTGNKPTVTIAPFNMVTRWAWKSGKTGETVPWDTMKSVYLEGSSYAADVLTLLDRDKNNTIGVHELVLDTEEKVRFIKTKLAAAGIEEPVIHGVIDAYKVNHGVVNLKQTKRDCSSCHSKGSRFGSPVVLSTRAPAGIVPEFQNSDGSAGSGIIIDGKVTISETGEVVLKRTRSPVGYYVFGHSRISVLDGLGFWIFLVSVLIVLIHGGIRYISSLRHPAPHVVTREVYMYRFYERLWHWTMATGVMLLAVTGLEVHYTGIFTLFGLETAVRLHNVLAAVLVINAVLSLFYHLVSGEIKQFFRFNRKFLQEVLVQVYFYVSGIFKRRPHPIGKTVERKLNPLQQLAYVGLLNVLLPFQVITGMLIWGVGQWPGLSDKLGGLTYLGPIHNFAAWLFLTFLVVHIYLTTTGHTVTSNLKAMIKGYDDVPEGETCDEHTALTDMRIMDLAGTLLGKLSKLKRRKGDKKGENERRKDDENDDE